MFRKINEAKLINFVETLALELLDRVSTPELLHQIIDTQFKPYVKKKGLVHDELLLDYAMEMMDGAAASTSVLNDGVFFKLHALPY